MHRTFGVTKPARQVAAQGAEVTRLEKSVELLRELVAFDTISSNSNLPMIEWVADLVADAGADVTLLPNEDGRKANLLARFGPEAPEGLVLSGHTDVVPVDGQDWTSDPFVLAERDGKLHGRGTTDMKGFIACCLAVLPELRAETLRRPVYLALSYDEELVCAGVASLVDALAEVRAAAAVIGEPTSLRSGDRHRGFLAFRTRIRGRAAHSSDPSQGQNAIAAAARFTQRLESLGVGAAAGADTTTVSVNQISGGTAMNIVPGECELGWEMRPAAGADLDALRHAAAALLLAETAGMPAPDLGEYGVVLPLERETNNAARDLSVRFGAVPGATDVPFGTEAGYFQAIGIPTVVCGPGSIEQAHQPDEWIAIDQMRRGVDFAAAAAEWAGETA